MITADTSLIVAAFASWHEAHGVASKACREVRRLPLHVMVEFFSVMTRLPEPHRVAPGPAEAYLASFDEPLAGPSGVTGTASFFRALREADLRGGQAYDALIARTAASHDARLRTRDLRAAAVYEAMGCTVEYVA